MARRFVWDGNPETAPDGPDEPGSYSAEDIEDREAQLDAEAEAYWEQRKLGAA